MTQKQRTLYLIDGSAIFYRAYFAFLRNPLINSKGENTSAAYGFISSLMKILREETPDYFGVVFDSKAPTFRHEKYAEYKSTRAKMPEELVVQLPRVRECVQALNIPSYELPGYEADDIVGTLALKAAKEGILVWCVTGDKDYLQLVNDNIRLYNPRKLAEQPERIGPDGVKAKFGVEANQVIDKLALMGDASDNVPGVPGIGPKTAEQLLAEFGTLDNILANLDKIKAKGTREKIAKNVDLALMSKDLVTLATDVPVELDLDALKRRPMDYEKAKKLFMELEFTALLKQLQPADSGAPALELDLDARPTGPAAEYHTVGSIKELKKIVTDFAKKREIAVDTETSSLDTLDAELVGVSLTDHARFGYYVPLRHTSDPKKNLPFDEAIELLKKLLENPRVQKIGQNIKYDFEVLSRHGIDVDPLSFDTMIASYVLNPSGRQHSLDYLAMKHFDHKMQEITELIGTGRNQKTFDTVPVDQATRYSGADADFTFRLRGVLAPEIERYELQNLYYNIELPLIKVLADMEMEGIRIDSSFLLALSNEMDAKIENLRAQIFKMVGMEFNINSTQQLSHILFEKLNLPTKGKTAKGTGYSTDVSVLEELARVHPFPKLILDFRQLGKLKSTYVDALPKLVNARTGRLHTSFNQTIAASGRLSSTDPNLQNIPVRTEEGREIRKAFIPRDDDHVLLTADYSQIELRILAHYTSDPGLVQAFKRGEDIHARTAANVFGVDIKDVTSDQRRVAKTTNFSVIYGVSAYGLSNQTDMTVEKAKEFIDAYFKTYPGIHTYIEETKAFARENGFVTTMYNRRRYLPEINDKNFQVRQFAERAAINTPIQGSAADIIKVAMIKIHKALEGMKSRMVLQVHDELIFDVHKSELDQVKKIVKDGMEKAVKLKVPVIADMGAGPNWLEAKS